MIYVNMDGARCWPHDHSLTVGQRRLSRKANAKTEWARRRKCEALKIGLNDGCAQKAIRQRGLAETADAIDADINFAALMRKNMTLRSSAELDNNLWAIAQWQDGDGHIWRFFY